MSLERGCHLCHLFRRLVAIAMGFTSTFAVAQMTDAEVAVFRDRLTKWVQGYYPELLSAKDLNDRTVVAFVVDSKDKVFDHTRGLQPIYTTPTPLVSEVTRMLPKWKDAKFVDHGAACFGSPHEKNKYCVMYAVVEQ